jgi:hypothetical protein
MATPPIGLTVSLVNLYSKVESRRATYQYGRGAVCSLMRPRLERIVDALSLNLLHHLECQFMAW